jgi:hypothetical protein
MSVAVSLEFWRADEAAVDVADAASNTGDCSSLMAMHVQII